VLLGCGVPVIDKGPPGVTTSVPTLLRQAWRLGAGSPIRIEPERPRSAVCGPCVIQSARLLLLVGATIPTFPQANSHYCQCRPPDCYLRCSGTVTGGLGESLLYSAPAGNRGPRVTPGLPVGCAAARAVLFFRDLPCRPSASVTGTVAARRALLED
jgi:hypothetical protein